MKSVALLINVSDALKPCLYGLDWSAVRLSDSDDNNASTCVGHRGKILQELTYISPGRETAAFLVIDPVTLLDALNEEMMNVI